LKLHQVDIQVNDFEALSLFFQFDKSPFLSYFHEIIVTEMLKKFSLVFVICALTVFVSTETAQTSRYKSAKCKSMNTSFLTFQECKVKVQSRTNSSFDVRTTLLEPIEKDFFVSLESFDEINSN
jgi:hypothetical protein